MPYIRQPFKLRDERGAIAVISNADAHLRDKVLAVLFTAPGERVNNPRFGVGLNRARRRRAARGHHLPADR